MNSDFYTNLTHSISLAANIIISITATTDCDGHNLSTSCWLSVILVPDIFEVILAFWLKKKNKMFQVYRFFICLIVWNHCLAVSLSRGKVWEPVGDGGRSGPLATGMP